MAADTPRASRARVPSAGQEPPRRTRAADDDAKLHESDKKRPKISVPLPASVKNLFASLSEPATAQVDEQGRVRAVPHVVGNFATHIYFRVPLERKELTALLELPSKAFGKGVWKEIDGEPHVSLSRTVFLRAYELEPFVARLRAEVGALKLGTFDASFSSWRVFGNDTGTRWFASLVQAGGVEESKALIGAADRALEAFAQPVYYEVGYFAGSVGPFPRGDPVPHASFAWSVEPVGAEAASQNRALPAGLVTRVDSLVCVTGKATHAVPLSA